MLYLLTKLNMCAIMRTIKHKKLYSKLKSVLKRCNELFSASRPDHFFIPASVIRMNHHIIHKKLLGEYYSRDENQTQDTSPEKIAYLN